jgi:predicted O-methyltransferase YrrM
MIYRLRYRVDHIRSSGNNRFTFRVKEWTIFPVWEEEKYMQDDLANEKNRLSLQDSLVRKPLSDPAGFFEMVNGLSRSADLLCAIAAAAHSGIFDELQSPRAIDDIAQSCPYRDMIVPLIRFLQSCGLITETGGKFVCPGEVTEFYSLTSPYSQIPYLDKLLWHLSEHWLHLESILRSGPLFYEEQEFFSRWSLPSMAANALTGRLQDVVLAVAALPGFSGCRKMVDLGGGHGLYALALASLNPDLQAVVFDLPEVIPLTKEYIVRYGMEDRVSLIGGNFFTDGIGTGYDIILSSSNPSGKAPVMIPKIASALNPGGYFVNIQPGDEDRAGDFCNELEWELWGFAGTDIPKSSWGRKKGFFTPEYHLSLTDAGLNVVSMSSIPDLYIQGHAVSMMIAQKR